MGYTVTKYPEGTFSWADMFSLDTEASKKFLVELMGWEAEDMPTGGGPVYTMFTKDGHNVAAMSAMPEDGKGLPAHWNNYVTVDDLDKSCAKVKELGGEVFMPAMDVMDVGRMAGIKDPGGGMLMLWQAKKHIGAGLVNTVGAMGWNELYSNDVEASKKFFEGMFGWTYEEMGGDGYFVIKNKGRMNGGMMEITEEMKEVPAHWLPYFTIENLDESLKKVKELGGKVHKEIDNPQVGRFAIIADPSGAVFTIIQLNQPADEWED